MDTADWGAINSPVISVLSSELCRDIKLGACTFLLSTYELQRNKVLHAYDSERLFSRQPEAIPFHAWTLPYLHLQFYHSNSCPWGSAYPADVTRHPGKQPSQPAIGHFYQLLWISETNSSNPSAAPLLHRSPVLSPLQRVSSQTVYLLLGKSWLLIMLPAALSI